MKRILGTIFILLCLLIWGMSIYYSVKGNYQYEALVQAEWNLADKSSAIPAKSQHLDKFVDALERQGFQGKYDAVIYQTPNNGFDQNLEALKTLQTRLHDIEKMDVTSFQYQTAIQQITAQEQGEAHAMLDVFEGIWWKEHYFLLWGWMGFITQTIGFVFLIVGVVFFFWAYETDY